MLKIIIDQPRTAASNMAADMELVNKCGAGEGYVFVRFYSWSPPAITLGYMQDPVPLLDIKAMERDSIEWIRRPTGGRAVLHKGDLTYSCVFPKSVHLMGGTVRESYELISRCLIKGLRIAGINCDTQDSLGEFLESKRETKLPCFLAPNRDEIMYNGKKLVGSAQKRTARAVLQHGSIPITPQYRDLPDYLILSDETKSAQKRLLAMKSICIEEISPDLDFDTLRKSLTEGFRETLSFIS